MKKLLNKGFTIVELVIVIAVIGILAAVLIPTFSNVIESANKTADLQEAQSSLKAYTGYMGSKGSAVPDGTVFAVKKDGTNVSTTFVFYKGQLHEFYAESTGLDVQKPKVSIGTTDYACNKLFEGFDANEDGKFDKATEQLTETVTEEGNPVIYHITFFYSDTQAVTFEDGSLKCNIYPGLVVKTIVDITSQTTDATVGNEKAWTDVPKYTSTPTPSN